jgi:hypothetical protein
MSQMMIRIVLTLLVSLSLFYFAIAQTSSPQKPSATSVPFSCPECVTNYTLKTPLTYNAATNIAAVSTEIALNCAPQKVEAVIATATSTITNCQNAGVQNIPVSILSMAVGTPTVTAGTILYPSDAITTLTISNTTLTTNLAFLLPPSACLPCTDVIKICVRYIFTCIENGVCRSCEKTICYEVKRGGKQCP